MKWTHFTIYIRGAPFFLLQSGAWLFVGAELGAHKKRLRENSWIRPVHHVKSNPTVCGPIPQKRGCVAASPGVSWVRPILCMWLVPNITRFVHSCGRMEQFTFRYRGVCRRFIECVLWAWNWKLEYGPEYGDGGYLWQWPVFNLRQF